MANGSGIERRPSVELASAAIRAWLDEHAPGHPEFSLCEDGDSNSAPNKCGWAFWIAPMDITSYLHEDMRVEWYGTGWPSQFSYDSETGNWTEIITSKSQSH